MNKYIDADKLKEHYAWWGEDSEEKRIIDEIVDVQPSADVVEVKHGKWQDVKRWECYTHSVTDMRCSVCHCYASRVLPHQIAYIYDFCPNCGADMRGRKETNDR